MADRGDDKKRAKQGGSKRKDEDELSDIADDPEFEKLPEVEKERRYMEQFEKREKERKRQELEKEAKANKGGAPPKPDLLSQLQNKRQIARDRKERMAAEEDDRRRDDSDEDYSESDGEINSKRRRKKDDDEDFVVDDEDKRALRSRPEKKRKRSTSPERRSPTKPQTVTMELLEKIRLSRKNLALLISHTIFEKAVKGAFVRVNQSSSTKAASAHDYAIAEVVGVQTYPKYYSVDDKETNKILLLKHGSKERPMKMCFISNGEFTGTEFTKWINRMQRENQKLPAIGDIDRKAEEIKKGLNYRYSNEEIRKNIDQRIDEKLKRGEALTTHEIEQIENQKLQKEREYWSTGSKNLGLKKEIDKLNESIKKSKEILKTQKKPGKREDKSVAQEMAEMFKDEDEEEEEAKKKEEESDEAEGEGDIEEEDEDERAALDKRIEELKKSGKSLTELYDEMKKDFIKNHKVDLSIDKFIEDWNIENEVA